MNILIITPFYKHDRNIASVRWTNIGIRLAKKHNVIVVTQPHDDMNMNTTIERDENNILVARINQKTWYEKTAVNHFGGATGDDWQTSAGTGESEQIKDSFIRKMKNRLLYGSMKSKARQYAKYIVKNVIPNDFKTDVVISSACPFIEMLFGYELKKRLRCKWISDFRDLPYQEDVNDDTHRMKKIVTDVLPKADAITIVASSSKKKLEEFPNLDTNKIHLLTNGFSLSDKKESFTINDNILHIVHTGSLYGGRRNPEMLFQAVRSLKNNKPEFKVIVECAGGNNTPFINAAHKYDCEACLCDYGFISRDKALELQSKTDCLLAIVEPYALPAKLFEYTLSSKPIICLLMGNENRSEAEPYINNLNLGIVIKEKNRETDVNVLSKYLAEQFDRKVQGEPLKYSPNQEQVKKYDHDYLVLEFEKILKNI